VVDAALDLSRASRRLLSELDDDGVVIDAEGPILALILDELGYARRPPRFERRTPVYGSIIVPGDRSLVTAGDLADLIPLDDQPLDVARRYADGRASFLVLEPDGRRSLALFRRSVQYEADLIQIQADTGVYIVQRTPVLHATRLFTSTRTIEWSGYRWTARATAAAQQRKLDPHLPPIPRPVVGGLLELALHWLSPSRVGATFVVPVDGVRDGLDIERAVDAPELSVVHRHHYPALLAALTQTDLATLVDHRGAIHHLGVGLRWSLEAEAAVAIEDKGMRHRSAARWTYDHPDALAVVVSEDGPVSVFRQGRALTKCVGAPRVELPEATAS